MTSDQLVALVGPWAGAGHLMQNIDKLQAYIISKFIVGKWTAVSSLRHGLGLSLDHAPGHLVR